MHCWAHSRQERRRAGVFQSCQAQNAGDTQIVPLDVCGVISIQVDKGRNRIYFPPKSCCVWKRKYCFTSTYWHHGFRKIFGDFHLFMSLRKGKMGDFSKHREDTSRTREQWWLSWAFSSAWRINMGLNQSRSPKKIAQQACGEPQIFFVFSLVLLTASPQIRTLCLCAWSGFLPFDATILSYTLSSLLWDEDVEGFPSHHREIPAVLKEAKI